MNTLNKRIMRVRRLIKHYNHPDNYAYLLELRGELKGLLYAKRTMR